MGAYTCRLLTSDFAFPVSTEASAMHGELGVLGAISAIAPSGFQGAPMTIIDQCITPADEELEDFVVQRQAPQSRRWRFPSSKTSSQFDTFAAKRLTRHCKTRF